MPPGRASFGACFDLYSFFKKSLVIVIGLWKRVITIGMAVWNQMPFTGKQGSSTGFERNERPVYQRFISDFHQISWLVE